MEFDNHFYINYNPHNFHFLCGLALFLESYAHMNHSTITKLSASYYTNNF